MADSGPASEQRPLDSATFDALVSSVGGGEEGRAFVQELVSEFFEDAPVQLDDLRAAIAAGDAAEARRAAHTLKSNGATLGALRFSGLCRDLELLAGEGGFAATPTLVEELELEWTRVREALEVAAK